MRHHSILLPILVALVCLVLLSPLVWALPASTSESVTGTLTINQVENVASDVCEGGGLGVNCNHASATNLTFQLKLKRVGSTTEWADDGSTWTASYSEVGGELNASCRLDAEASLIGTSGTGLGLLDMEYDPAKPPGSSFSIRISTSRTMARRQGTYTPLTPGARCPAGYDETFSLNLYHQSCPENANGIRGVTRPGGTLDFTCQAEYDRRWPGIAEHVSIQASNGASCNATPPPTNPSPPVACVPHAAFTHKVVGETIADFGKVDFDARASVDPLGPIQRYDWKWGEGGEDSTGQPNTTYRYEHGGDFEVRMRFPDANGNLSNEATETVRLCPREPLAVVLPAVDVSYSDLIKILRVKYGELALSFSYIKPAKDATCSFTATGTLPVTIGIGPFVFGVDVPISSSAIAQLDFLAEGVHAPDCKWSVPYRGASVPQECVVGGTGDTLVRWTTKGFSERVGGVEVFNSGSLTYYMRVPSRSTYAQAIAALEPLLHVELSKHLGWIDPFYMIQEPPAGLNVIDSAGRITGLPRPGEQPVQRIPGSLYFSDGKEYSAVVLLVPPTDGFTVHLLGAPGSSYSLSVAKIFPVGAASTTKDFSITGSIGGTGVVTLKCIDGVVVGSWPKPNGSLVGIARLAYNDARRWVDIYHANKAGVRRPDGTVGMIVNPDVIHPGWRLWVPGGAIQHCG